MTSLSICLTPYSLSHSSIISFIISSYPPIIATSSVCISAMTSSFSFVNLLRCKHLWSLSTLWLSQDVHILQFLLYVLIESHTLQKASVVDPGGAVCPDCASFSLLRFLFTFVTIFFISLSLSSFRALNICISCIPMADR